MALKITPLGFAKAHGPNTSSPQFSTTHRDALALQQPQRDALSRVLSRALLLRLPALQGLSLPVHAGYARRGPGPNACWSWIPFPPLPPVTSPTPVKLTVRAAVPSLARACSGWGAALPLAGMSLGCRTRSRRSSRSATTRCALPAWRRCNLRVLFALSVSPHTLITICI